jgi:hypothetical protein
MACEVKPWKQEGCVVSVNTAGLSDRETHSREINEALGEGGGLNANYQTVEVVAMVANILGRSGLVYGDDFVFKTAGLDEISFDFCDQDTKIHAEFVLSQLVN